VEKVSLENAALVFEEAVPVKKYSLGSSDLRGLVDPKLKIISITRQTELLSINRPTLYYKKRQVRLDEERALIARIQELYSKVSILWL